MPLKSKEPLQGCYHDVIEGKCKRVGFSELLKIQHGDFQLRNRNEAVVAVFHHDELEWIRPMPKKGAI